MPKSPSNKFLPRGVTLLYEDADLLVINKPAGLLSVPAHYEKEKNALSLMTHFYRKGQVKSRKELFPINRLDRETSGILLFAKSLEMRERFHDDWSLVEKDYLAVVAGRVEQDSGIIESYLIQDENYRVHETQDSSRGKLARTKFETIFRGKAYTTLLVRLLTGRKNQIRVHFSSRGHPVLGDTMYGKGRARRLALHAWRVSFEHPRNGKHIVLEAGLPEFFAPYLPAGNNLPQAAIN